MGRGRRLLGNARLASRVAELCPKAEKETASRVEIIVERNLTIRAERVKALAVWEGCRQVMRARANDPANQDVPGIKTGLLAVTWKMRGKTPVKKATVDAPLLREMRRLEEQVAREFGQRMTKQDAVLTIRSVRDLSNEELEALIAEARRSPPRRRRS